MPPLKTDAPKIVNRGAAGLLSKVSLPEGTAPLAEWRPSGKPNKISPALKGLIVEIAGLTPDPLNAREHNERNLTAIMQSLDLYGQVKPVVVRKKGRVVMAGNGTMEAARRLGWTKIAASVVDLDEVQAAGYGLADNRSAELASWNLEVLARLAKLQQEAGEVVVGWSAEEVFAMRMQDVLEHTDPDTVPEPPPVPVSKLGDLWMLGDHRLLCGDSTSAEAVAELLAGAVPFMTVTDPPYGVDYDPAWRNVEAAKGNLAYAARRVRPVMNDTIADWSAAWNLFPGDVIYSWHPPGATSLVHAKALQDSGFVLRMQIVWAKSNFPIGRGDYHVRHEPCWYAVRKGKSSRRTEDRTQTTLWQINLDRNVEGGHSTQKPVECMARPIRNHGGLADHVYDPFVGSGTTIIACQMLGRTCYAMELDPVYVDVALQRWADFTGLDPVRERDGKKFSKLKKS